MQKVTTFLWYDNNAEEAINLYTSLIKNSKIVDISRYGEGAPFPAGTLFTATFELDGQEFMVINGGPHFKLNEAVSLMVKCETQAEVDELWTKLTAGGEESQCGWLKDKFGLSWQIVPVAMMKMLGDPNPAKAQNVMQAMLKMTKIETAVLQRAYDQA